MYPPASRATLYVDPTDWSVKAYTDRGAQVSYLDRWRIVVAAGDLEHVIFEADPSTIASE